MKHIVEFTHYGWFGIRPVMFSELESGSPIIEPPLLLSLVNIQIQSKKAPTTKRPKNT